MTDADIGLVRELIQLQAPARSLSLAARRRRYERAESVFGHRRSPADQKVDAGGCAAEWILPPRGVEPTVLIYLHGGGYCLGSSRSHRHLATAIGSSAKAAVLSLNYRRAPEHAFPAAVEDARAATTWMMQRTTAPVVLVGDSAGGGLAIATMLALRDNGVRLPQGCVCLSPWVDLRCSSDAHTRLAERDPVLRTSELRQMADYYLKGADPRHPLASPVFGKLAGLPPLLVQVGSDEILLDDALALARAARKEGVDVALQQWPGMVHVWQWYSPVLEEGRQAIARIGEFVDALVSRRLSSGTAPAAWTAPKSRLAWTAKVRPASLIQEAHLKIVSSTTGGGFLSWVYQLNGPLDVRALERAIDDVVCRHEILRVRFERRGGRADQVVTPFRAGVLRVVDLSGMDKRYALEVAVADARRNYNSLSPIVDSRFRASLYKIDRKTSVLAMFVAEALVDSDSGALLSAAITRAYAEHSDTTAPATLSTVLDASYLDYVIAHPPDPLAVRSAREHWIYQAHEVHLSPTWMAGAAGEPREGSTFAFALSPAEWAKAVSRARSLGTTPYVLILTCWRVALARAYGLNHVLAHSIVSVRDRSAHGMIGNFHSLVRISLRFDSSDPPRRTLGDTATAVADAIEHSALPAPLALYDAGVAGDPLAGIRFYMFASHGGPGFAGVRRRRFRLHGPPRAALSLSCVYGPEGRQDFVFSSTLLSQSQLALLAAGVRAVLCSALSDEEWQCWGQAADSLTSQRLALAL